ncbi:MAG: leucyl/phenylalanyl-tRNA--protein transferase [Clostridia bacterium]|nr:leucyl/phenylalanyl-tRNA--protein transferase [Clostridia bacterium]
MPVFRLTSDLVFPRPEFANKDGLLAIGGDLSVNRLLLAYRSGIFPWYSSNYPILWWSPDPRCVLFPSDIKVSKSMKKVLRRGTFSITFDTCFETVIGKCMELRQDNTWLNDDMVCAYCKLHEMGFAHSVETWHEGKLAGGLYGVSEGKCFFGESMFSTVDNASKAALIFLAEKLRELGFLFIDCQVYSRHLESMGAVNIPRNDFLRLLSDGLQFETMRASWSGI